MSKIVKPKLHELPRSIDRVSFVYLDQTAINVEGGSIVAWREDVRLTIPASSIVCLVLGPGSKITHDAVKLLGGAGTTIVWMGADQTRFYAAGRPLSSSSKMIEAQAKVVSDKRKRLACAKKMYGLRFPGIDASSKTSMDSLRGMEGARMREIYRDEATRVGIKWKGRIPTFDSIEIMADDDNSNIVNRSMTIGNQVLYAVLLGVLNAVGMSPGLGIIHCGCTESFIYDLSDLYKSELTIPVAFDVAVSGVGVNEFSKIDRLTRTQVRQKIKECSLLKRSIADLKFLFLDKGEVLEGLPAEELIWIDEAGGLWDANGVLPAHTNYDSSYSPDPLELDELEKV